MTDADDYQAKRDALLAAENALIEQREQVAQLPALSAFRCGSDGSIVHCYTTVGSLVERHHRAMDLFTPVWNLLDLLPEGRGDWMPSHDYEANDV